MGLDAKRTFDLAIASAAAIPGAALCAFAIVVIRMDSPGPAIFRQVRSGRDGSHFVLYKLRTMSVDTGDRPSHDVMEAQITRAGLVLRALKFDEVPQLLNVLRGEMSLVGPRPCLPSQIAVLEERRRYGVDALRPGITGPSQLSRVDMSTPTKLAKTDATYLGAWSPIRDLKMLVATVIGHGTGDAARSSTQEHQEISDDISS